MLTVIFICVTLYLSVITVCRTLIRVVNLLQAAGTHNSEALEAMNKALDETYNKPGKDAPVNFDQVIEAINEVFDEDEDR